MATLFEQLLARLREHDQEHLLAWWDHLTEAERRQLVSQLESLDLAGLRRLYQERERLCAVPSPDAIMPIEVLPPSSPDDAEAKRIGEQTLREGKAATLLVAGGQGTRLDFPHAKGKFPIGPVSGKSLYQMHAEKVLALRRRYGASIPFLVMTSHATHDETEEYFAEHDYFGLPETDVLFFCQGAMPAMDLNTGRLILEERGKLFLSPDGHGGMLYALAGSGLLDRLLQRGFEHVFYFQVDNPLIKVLDPVFLGRHVMHRSEASSKTVAKLGPDEAAGVFASVEGACRILEYSELNDELRQRQDPSGRLALWAASPAIHIFDLAFLSRIAEHPEPLPFHAARKKTPYLDEQGNVVEPAAPNALKLERFIFDTLPRAERWLILETPRAEEFAPVKNKKGADTPEIARAMITRQTAAWLEAAGIPVPRDASGEPAHPLEVSPLYALDAEELAERVDASTRIDGPWYGTPT